MSHDVSRIVRTETCISMAINAFIPAGIIWLVGLPPPATLGEADGLVQGILKASGLATLMMTLVLTNIIRARVRSGGLPASDPAQVTGPGRFLPRSLFLRAPLMAVIAIVVLVPIGVIVASAFDLLPLGPVGAVTFNILFGALVGLTMTPPVVRRALADSGKTPGERS